MKSLYKHAPNNPFHISVGAVLVNSENKVRAHKLTIATTPQKHLDKLGGLEEVYILMRESLENGETLEEAVLRGIHEEFGVEGKVVSYLGSIQTRIPEIAEWEKTTLYLHVLLTKEGVRPQGDGEGHTELVWMEPNVLLKKMRIQGERGNRGDIDESKIIEAFLKTQK